MKRLLWSIPAIAIYFYATTILTQYSYVSYFNIPASFIEPSLRDNVIYFYQFFIVAKTIVGTIRWWAWGIVGVASLVIVLLCYISEFWKWYLTVVSTALFFAIIFIVIPKFGTVLAQNNSRFFVPSADCQSIGPEGRYIAPLVTSENVVFVAIDENNHLLDGFIAKDPSELPCFLRFMDIGKIAK